MSIIPIILIILVLSAFFSGMEVAFVSSNKLRFELDKKLKSITTSILSIFYDHPQQFISTMLVGNYICLVIYGLLMVELLTPYLLFSQNQLLIILLQIIIVFIIALFTRELIPKAIFQINANGWLRIFAPLLLIFYIVLYPVSRFITWFSSLILGVRLNKDDEKKAFSRIDFNYLIAESYEGVTNEQEIENEVKILQNALDFLNVKLHDCYIPRLEIIALNYETSVEILMQTFIETGLSKIIIYKNDIDNIVGYIHSSEMFTHQKNWREHINQILIVHENMAAQKLMKIFMQKKKSIAVVTDKFGKTAGIITLEDIFEKIFGDIEDEHDMHNYISEKINDNEYLFSGRLEVKIINETYHLHIPESDKYDTIAGFILYHYQRFPKLNEIIKINRFHLKCTKITNNRVDLVKLSVVDE